VGRSTRQQALVTRERILDTAERLFEKHGVSRTSLEDIAVAAGVTRGAIYGHFTSKGDLFVAMWQRIRPPVDSLHDSGPQDKDDPLGQLRTMLVVMFKLVSTKRQDQRVLHIMFHKCELTDDMDELARHSRRITERDGQRRLALLRRAVKLGQLPKGLNVKRAEVMFRAIMLGTISNWTLAPDSFSLKREAEALVDGYIDMLRFSPALRTRRRAG
jgi:TetR/AcrR family transcriptional regulator, acrAB operon repressor